MSDPIIEISGLTKRYGELTAVDQLDLSINKGEVFGLLGPNGAGKSTTILMMLGLTEPTAGRVTVCGIDATRHPIEVKRKTGYLPDEVGFYDNRTGLENLIYTARLNRIPSGEAAERGARLMKRVGLQDAMNKKTGTYSRGMRQRLGLADVLIKSPEVIILDEPTLGIDPLGVREFLDLIVQLSKEEGLTVLLSSHHLHQVQQVCDRVGIFVSGKLLAEGDIPALSRKLFSGDAYMIEAAVDASGSPDVAEKLQGVLKAVEGVNTVQITANSIQVGSSYDVSARIAREIIHSGFDLTYLNRKTYGLDDIYTRYFGEDKVYGKTA
jgi:ABC-2 type transport system ATP-binding protein